MNNLILFGEGKKKKKDLLKLYNGQPFRLKTFTPTLINKNLTLFCEFPACLPKKFTFRPTEQ